MQVLYADFGVCSMQLKAEFAVCQKYPDVILIWKKSCQHCPTVTAGNFNNNEVENQTQRYFSFFYQCCSVIAVETLIKGGNCCKFYEK